LKSGSTTDPHPITVAADPDKTAKTDPGFVLWAAGVLAVFVLKKASDAVSVRVPR